jgi:hypothetical protein
MAAEILRPQRIAGSTRAQISAPGAETRTCGDCTLCCRVVPVLELAKPPDVWCQHCDPKAGCRIYDQRPNSCRKWWCVWLLDEQLPEAMKPNRSHVIFDMMSDRVIAEGKPTDVVQLWCDPHYPTAWREPLVLDAIERYAANCGAPTLVRFNGEKATLVSPPSLTGDSRWHLVECGMAEDRAKFTQRLEALESGVAGG